jgi:hypothetical protein
MRKLCAVPAVSVTFAASLCTPLCPDDTAPLKSQITSIIDKEYPSLDALSKDIHSHPELSLRGVVGNLCETGKSG